MKTYNAVKLHNTVAKTKPAENVGITEPIETFGLAIIAPLDFPDEPEIKITLAPPRISERYRKK